MGLFKRSKKEIPAELPDLALDSEEKPFGNEENSNLNNMTKSDFAPANTEFPVQKRQEYTKKSASESNSFESDDDDKGFFKDLIKNLIDEQKNVDKMESFYNNKFASDDLVHQMRTYWEEQKPELLLKNVGSDLKAKMNEKTNKLHILEKEWQDIYFALLSKEEEIRTEEKDLKEVIGEYITICKKALGKKSKTK
jgi:hypothetical protein